MYRCVLFVVFGLALSAPFVASAQVQRNFPHNALRGEIAVSDPPEVLLNGRGARLAPGARLRGPDNLLLVSGALIGQRFDAHYTVDTLGLVKEVWVLRPEENQGRWPRTAEEAASWRFDPIAQTWSQP